MKELELKDKYSLTVPEPIRYFGIGERKMYMLAAEHADTDDFAFMKGTHYMIIREEFEKFLAKTSSI